MELNIDIDTVTEKALLIIFIALSGYAYLESETFSQEVAQFPQLMALIVLIGSLLIFFQNYLPQPIYSVVAESSSIVDEPTESGVQEGSNKISTNESATMEEPLPENNENSTSVVNKLQRNESLHAMLFTAGATLGYVFASYYLSILIASPVFVIAYGLWFDIPKKVIVFISILSVVVIWGFVEILYIPLDEGALIGGIV